MAPRRRATGHFSQNVVDLILSVSERGRAKVNSSSPGQNGHHLADDTFRSILLNEKLCILINISLKFVPKGPIDNLRALV